MPDVYEQPEHGWTCFYCGETFTTEGAASDHFGSGELGFTEPGCLIDYRVQVEVGGTPERGRGLLMALRKAEAEIQDLRKQVEELDNDAGSYHAYQAELERYFGKGRRTPQQAFMELDFVRGEVLTRTELLKKLEWVGEVPRKLKVSCPCCGGFHPKYHEKFDSDQRAQFTAGHKPDCLLASFINTQPEGLHGQKV